MPVRFHCPACQQLLSVAARKVGSQVKCPKCQRPIVVPTEPSAPTPPKPAAKQAAASSRGGTQVAPPPPAEQPTARPRKSTTERSTTERTAVDRSAAERTSAEPRISDVIVYDDIAAVLGSTPVVTVTTPAPQRATAPEIDRSLVTISRRTLYFQAVMISIFIGLALAGGYLAGRGARAPEVDPAKLKPVAVQGRVSYPADGNQVLPDADSVIVVFPKGTRLGEKIPIAGLRPDDPPPAENHPGLQMISSSDGQYLRADAQGQFEFRVKPGVYQVLVISKHAQRPGNTQPKPKDLLTLGGWFQPAPDLLGQHRYDFGERRLPEESPLNVTFARSP